MKPLVLSMGASLLILGAAWAQNTGTGGSEAQLPVGQVFKNFEFPLYENGQKKATLTATEARGITLNRAETTDLKIELYDNAAVTTTVTSPKADLYVAGKKMRTKDTVRIVRNDMEATAQTCDFDLLTKKYLLRTNVKVILKNFDTHLTPAAPAAPTQAAPSVPTPSAPAPSTPRPSPANQSLLDSPGAYSNTNSAPIPPTRPDTELNSNPTPHH